MEQQDQKPVDDAQWAVGEYRTALDEVECFIKAQVEKALIWAEIEVLATNGQEYSPAMTLIEGSYSSDSQKVVISLNSSELLDMISSENSLELLERHFAMIMPKRVKFVYRSMVA